MRRLMIIVMLGLFSGMLWAQTESEEEPVPPVSLADLVENADLVALVQVLDTDYEYTREFPSGGRAFLRVLIPYKVTRSLEDILEVYDEGLHTGECYFDNPSVFEEGRRHLVFLKFSEDVAEQYNGLRQGCKLEVLVRKDGLYALRFPLNGLELLEDLSPHVTAMEFQDAYAVLDDEEISPDLRNDLLEKGYLRAVDQRYEFTHGIDVTVFRKLLGSQGLTLDRSLKQ